MLLSVPDSVRARIKDCQPFTRPEPERTSDPLRLLSDLDNQDKHGPALATMVNMIELLATHSIEFGDEIAAGRNAPPDMTIHAAAVEPNALLLSGKTLDRIVRIAGGSNITFQVGIDPGSGFIGAVELTHSLSAYIGQVVDYVSTIPTALRAPGATSHAV